MSIMRTSIFLLAALLLGCGTSHPTPEEAADNEKLIASTRNILALSEKRELIARDFVAAGNYSLWPSPDPEATARQAIAEMQADNQAIHTALADFQAAVAGTNWSVTEARKARLKAVLTEIAGRSQTDAQVAPTPPAE